MTRLAALIAIIGTLYLIFTPEANAQGFAMKEYHDSGVFEE